jgi:hypothetical protein
MSWNEEQTEIEERNNREDRMSEIRKKCPKCKKNLPICEYSKRSNRKSGIASRCKKCLKISDRMYRQVNRIRIAKYAKKYRQINKDRILEYNKKHKPVTRLHSKAHWAVRSSLIRGLIRKEPCKYCGDLGTEAHHSDYSKPLDILWVCKKHHRRIHANGLEVSQ